MGVGACKGATDKTGTALGEGIATVADALGVDVVGVVGVGVGGETGSVSISNFS